MTDRKLEALRALAERPGTPAEGEVARAMLARYEKIAGRNVPQPDPYPGMDPVQYADQMIDDLLKEFETRLKAEDLEGKRFTTRWTPSDELYNRVMGRRTRKRTRGL